MGGVMLVEEQRLVVDCSAPVVVVTAFAGTGKSTTLRGCAEARPASRFLYLVFNKAAQVEAEAKFPANVRVMTFHGMAYRAVGKRYARKQGSSSPVAVSRLLKVSVPVARSAIVMVNRFLHSACPTLREAVKPRVSELLVFQVAEKLWARMQDLGDDVPMSHDGYLKLFQLEDRQLDGYDVVMVDEFQDSNEVSVAIVRQQRAAQVVVVGDPHQSVYSFRGSVNALGHFDGDRLFLTGSFRFGSAVARVANAVLAQKGERRKLVGLGGPTEVRVDGSHQRHAFLSRTNAGALMYASSKPGSIFFTGGFEAYRPNRIRDAYSLWKGRADDVTDPEFRHFTTYAALERYAHSANDSEIQSVLFFVKSNGDGTPGILDDLQARADTRTGRCAFAVSTFHKAKGAEYGAVVLGESLDWDEFVEERRKGLSTDMIEELNLLYVAATRAKNVLHINRTLRYMLEEYNGGGIAPSAAA